MKRAFTLLLAAVLLLSLPVTASAANSTGGKADITTRIEPTYTVTIPADVTVRFNDVKTCFGAIEVVDAQIHPDKCIKVCLASDGKLENGIDASKVLPYAIKDRRGNTFTSAVYLTEGDKTELFIHITPDDWKAAYAGEYSDTVTFTVSYENKR